jgi:hypothetical protein
MSGVGTIRLVALLGALCSVTGAWAQGFRQRPRLFIDRVDASQPPVVRLYVTELDESARVAPVRAKKDYRILVNGLPQSPAVALQRFSELREPLAVVLVIQVSPSMRDPLAEIVGASKRFIAQLPDRSMVGLVAYADVVTTQTKLTPPMKAVSELDALKIREGIEIQLPDAVRDALEILSAPKLPQRRMMVVVSDGITVNLDFKIFSDLGRQGRDRGVAIHSVGYAPLEPTRLRTLHDLSRRGGGTFRQAPDAAAISAAFEALREEVENQLVLSYNLAKLFDGKVCDFQIEVSGGLASNIVPIELSTKKTDDEASSLWDEVWVLVIIGLAVVGLTVVLALVWRWVSARSPRPPRPSGRRSPSYDDDDDIDDAEDDDEPDYSPPRKKQRRDADHADGDERRLRRLTAKANKEALEELFKPQRPAPRAASPRHEDPALELEDQNFMHQVDDELSLTGRVSSRVSQHPGSPGFPEAPGRESFGGEPFPPVAGDQPYAPVAPPPFAHPAQSRPGASAPYPQPQPPSGAAPFPGPSQPTGPHRPPQVSGPHQPPGPPSQPSGAAPFPGAASFPGAPPPQGAEAPGEGGFRLPLPDPEEFIRQRKGGEPSHSQQMPQRRDPSQVPHRGDPSQPRVHRGRADPSQPQVHRGRGDPSQSKMPTGGSPVPSSSPASPAVGGAGIPLMPGSALKPLPVELVKPTANQPPPARFNYCKTQVIPEEDISKVDLVAWIVPLDGLQFETINIRDGFTLGSGDQCDLQVQADGVQSEHLVFRASGSGYGLMPPGEGKPYIPLLRDNDRFHIGAMEFIYKCQSWFPQNPMHEASLVVLDGMDQGRTLELKHRVVYTIGTHPTCKLVIRGEGVSPRHAVVMLKDRKCLVADLGSDTGLRWHGELVGRQVLRPGTEVSLGTIRLLFQLEDITGEKMIKSVSRSGV